VIVLQSIGVGLLSLSVLAACAATALAPAPTRTPVPTPTAPPPLLVIALGDSLTQGDKDESPQGGGWPRRLLPLVQSARPQTQIVNLAQPGWTSRDVLKGVDAAPNQIDQAAKILHETSGDRIATLWIGVNDLFYLYEFGDPTPAGEAREADRFARDLDEMLDRLKRAGARVCIALLHDPAHGPVQTSGVFVSTAVDEWARMAQQAQHYNEIIRAAAAKHDATLVDIPATRIFTTPELMFEDGIHPNARGYDELTMVWWTAIRDTMTR
jgi:lysophospholipase L1-like esterase